MLRLEDAVLRMKKVGESFSADISSIRTGRASGSLVENVEVSVYGGTQRLRIVELAAVSVADSQTITISPWDESIMGEVRKGIMEANVGLNPTIDGRLLRISVPPLTTERRGEFVKILHQRMEEARVSIRQVRHDKMLEIKKALVAKEITEDDQKRLEKQLQEITDRAVSEIEELGKRKEEELVTV